MKLTRKTKIGAGSMILSLGLLGVITGCTSDADRASENTSKKAEMFEVQRRIVGVNGITGKYEFMVEGRCSLETANSALSGSLEIMCKHASDDYRKHFIHLSDNTFFVATQLDGIDVSEYHTKIIIKPQNLLPDLDLQMGE